MTKLVDVKIHKGKMEVRDHVAKPVMIGVDTATRRYLKMFACNNEITVKELVQSFAVCLDIADTHARTGVKGGDPFWARFKKFILDEIKERRGEPF